MREIYLGVLLCQNIFRNSFFFWKYEYNTTMNYDMHQHLLAYKTQFQKEWFCVDLFLETSKSLDFSFLTESSSVYSSNIEWNTLNLNSFMNAKLQKNTEISNKEVQEIENLKKAYTFTQENTLTQENFLQVHNICSKTLLIEPQRWVYRKEPVWVFGSQWLIYMAVEAEFVQKYMDELFWEIQKLLQKDLSISEVLYYASFLHLRFVHIHPFSDGNWRVARILEKWFLTQKLWREFWKLQSEKFYWEHRDGYYANINLGVNFYELDYSEVMPFLFMLPESLRN